MHVKRISSYAKLPGPERPVLPAAVMAWDDQWTPEEWRCWRAEHDAIRRAAAVPGEAADWDEQWTREEWRIWRAEQDAIRPAAAVPGEAADWDDQWTPEEWRIWRAMQEALPPAGAAPDETAAPAPLSVFYDEPGPAETPASGSEPPN